MQNMNMYSFFNPQFHREQLMNAYNQYLQAQYPQLAQAQNMQNVAPIGFNIFPVSNIEEANATKADLNYNPTFFYNQSKGEIYLKQLDRSTNAATLRIFAETTPQPEQSPQQTENINQYGQQLNTILEGINGLYRLLSQLQAVNAEIVETDITEAKQIKGGRNAK